MSKPAKVTSPTQAFCVAVTQLKISLYENNNEQASQGNVSYSRFLFGSYSTIDINIGIIMSKPAKVTSPTQAFCVEVTQLKISLYENNNEQASQGNVSYTSFLCGSYTTKDIFI